MCSETNDLGMQDIKIKPWYKMTEIGVIPEDWEIKNLWEISDFYKWKWLPKSDIALWWIFKCIHYWELFTKYKEYITDVYSYTDKNDNIFLSKKNDILMPTSDVTPRWLATASCLNTNNIILWWDILIIRNNSKNLDWTYFSYNISQNKSRVLKLVSWSTVYHLYGSDMKKYKFSLPAIDEQKLIAKVLSDTDELITSLDELINKKEKIKEWTMQELLTWKRRLDWFNWAWEEKQIWSICEFYKWIGLPKSEIIWWWKYKCIHYWELFTTYNEEIKKIYSNTNTLNNIFKSKQNDVLMPTSDVTPNWLATASCINKNWIILGWDILVLDSINFHRLILNKALI